MTRLLGIYREQECSPGRHRSNDAWLLEAVAERMRGRFVVDLTTIDRAPTLRDKTALIFSMCQSRASLDALLNWELDGTPLVNSPRAALNTHRDRLPALMKAAGIPFPATRLVDTARGALTTLNEPVWLKRGDVHASVAADVQRVDSIDALAAGLAEFASRGVRLAALQEHVAGDEIKFYGVRGSFFHWLHPGETRGYPVNRAALGRLAADAAAAAGLDIFGGDVIVSPTGALTLIDLNDWPSFAPCREEAADAVARHLMRRVHAAWNAGMVSRANESAL